MFLDSCYHCSLAVKKQSSPYRGFHLHEVIVSIAKSEVNRIVMKSREGENPIQRAMFQLILSIPFQYQTKQAVYLVLPPKLA